jgi:DNA polymerase-3 subunit delta'
VRAFLADARVEAALSDGDASTTPPDELLRLAAGAPGALFGRRERSAAVADARRLLDAALSGTRADRLRAAFSRGAAGARGAFTDVLDALTELLRETAREAVRPDVPGGPAPADVRRAVGASRGVDAVERAKERAAGNASPQLVTEALLRELAAGFR